MSDQRQSNSLVHSEANEGKREEQEEQEATDPNQQQRQHSCMEELASSPLPLAYYAETSSTLSSSHDPEEGLVPLEAIQQQQQPQQTTSAIVKSPSSSSVTSAAAAPQVASIFSEERSVASAEAKIARMHRASVISPKLARLRDPEGGARPEPLPFCSTPPPPPFSFDATSDHGSSSPPAAARPMGGDPIEGHESTSVATSLDRNEDDSPPRTQPPQRNDSITRAFGLETPQTNATHQPNPVDLFSEGRNERALDSLVEQVKEASAEMSPQHTEEEGKDVAENAKSKEGEKEEWKTPTVVVDDVDGAREGTADGGRRLVAEAATPSPQRATFDDIAKASKEASPSPLRSSVLYSAIQIRASAVYDVVMATVRQQPEETSKKKPSMYLPSSLDMPLFMRCEFCQKFDSVCSVCHKRWKGICEHAAASFRVAFLALPEGRRVACFYAAVARGSKSFVEQIIEAEPVSVHWYANCYLMPDDFVANLELFEECGRMFPLHVAMAFNRIDIADMLLRAGAKVRRSERRVLPTQLLGDTIPPEWEEMLEQHSAYVQHCISERARRLRSEGQFEAAMNEYTALLAENGKSEHAHCGIAKMRYDQGLYEECVAVCDQMTADPLMVDWMEFGPATVSQLRQQAVERYHEVCHSGPGSALRKCGCIITDAVVIPLRRIPFRIVADHIFSFCDVHSLFSVWLALKSPLIRDTAEIIASTHKDVSLGEMLSKEFGYAEMYESIRTDTPPSSIVAPPLEFLGVQVVAMGGFHTYIVKATVAGNALKKKKGFWGSESKRVRRVVVSKQFRINRAGINKAWDIHEAGEWEEEQQETN